MARDDLFCQDPGMHVCLSKEGRTRGAEIHTPPEMSIYRHLNIHLTLGHMPILFLHHLTEVMKKA
jgi:hypothetical protein